MDVLPNGIVLSQTEIERNFIKAVRFYCGYAALTDSELADGIHSDFGSDIEVKGCTDRDITFSELAIIRPLFDLYVELENALNLEASRGEGLEMWGRASSEVQADIREMEMDMPRKAFMEPPFTV
jgi:hypothetical protein